MFNRETRYKAVVHYKYFDHSLRRVSKLYGVSKSSLQRWVHADPAVRSASRRRTTAFHGVRECIRRLVRDNPFMTMHQLADAIREHCGVSRCRTSIGQYCRKAGFTLKKAFRTVSGRPNAEQLRTFCTEHAATGSDLICLDEACFHVGDVPRRGYAPRGTRLNVLRSARMRCSKYTLLMAISGSGILHYTVYNHNVTKADFVQFITELPVQPGRRLLMDNLRIHHSKETHVALKDKGITPLYIPPYSPKYNAIENVFGMLKAQYRRACPAQPSLTVDYPAIMHSVIQQHRATDLTPYLRHAVAHSMHVLSNPDAAFCGHD